MWTAHRNGYKGKGGTVMICCRCRQSIRMPARGREVLVKGVIDVEGASKQREVVL